MELLNVNRRTYLNLRAKQELTDKQRFELCYKIASYFITEGNLHKQHSDFSKGIEFLDKYIRLINSNTPINKSVSTEANALLQSSGLNALKNGKILGRNKITEPTEHAYSALYYALSAIVEKDEESEFMMHVLAYKYDSYFNKALEYVDDNSRLKEDRDAQRIIDVLWSCCEDNETKLLVITRAIHDSIYPCDQAEDGAFETFANIMGTFNSEEMKGIKVTMKDIEFCNEIEMHSEYEYLKYTSCYELVVKAFKEELKEASDLTPIQELVKDHTNRYKGLFQFFSSLPYAVRWMEH